MGARPSKPLYGNPQRITADAVVLASPGTLMAVQLNGGTATCLMSFHNHASSATGTQLYDIIAPFTDSDGSSNSSVFIDLQVVGGIHFDVGCYVNWTGTAAVGYVWFASD